MARVLSFNYLPALSPVSTKSNTQKPISTLVLSVRFFSKPIESVGYAHQVRNRATVARYRSGLRRGFDLDDETWLEEGEEEEIAKQEKDPNLDLDRIESSTVRVLDEQNQMLGVMPIREARRRAASMNLVLAIISPQADPPVLRLFQEKDYKKHKYERQKKQKVQQKKTATKVKELKMGYCIDQHDYAVRQKQATKFLKEGHKVKVIVNLRGRENKYKNQAIDLLRQFQKDMGKLASEESKNFNESNIFIMLMPNKATIQREQQLKQREEQLKKQEAEASREELKKQDAEASTEEQLKEQEAEASTEEQPKEQEAEAGASTEEMYSVNI